ncbi:MAG: type II secretion system F family protein [Candidatus Omnitrophica bacterium]|nr:type II secretion system F family protein [Candidatus Omnitrophota bacterium]
MARFIYKAKKGPKEIKEDSIEADSESAAVRQLMQQGYYPIWVKEASIGSAEKRDTFSLSSKRIKTKDIANFTRQLSELLDSGLALYEALNIIENQIELPGLREVIKGIREKVRDGNTFSDSLKDYPRIFSKLYI